MTSKHFSVLAGFLGLGVALLLAPATFPAAAQQQGPPPNQGQRSSKPGQNSRPGNAQNSRPTPGQKSPSRPPSNSRPSPNRPAPSRPANRPAASRPATRPAPKRPVAHPAPSSRSYAFRSQDISRLRSQYRSNYANVNRARRPHFYRGGYIPVTYRRYFQPVPPAVIGYLPPVPPGYAVGYYDGYVAVYSLATFAILNLIDLMSQ